MWRWFKLLMAGYTRLSFCWLGLHRWSMPGGWCENCGRCDLFFPVAHYGCGKTCRHWEGRK